MAGRERFPDHIPNCSSENERTQILNRWKTAPFVTEPFGNGSSPTFPCETFVTDPKTGAFLISTQVPQFHIAIIKNGAMCTGAWDVLTADQQRTWLQAGHSAGYRFAPVAINISELPKASPSARRLSILTHWSNFGVTPAYDAWVVETSLWTTNDGQVKQTERARMTSNVDLRKVLPTGNVPIAVEDIFELPKDMRVGTYELRVRVIDPRGYMNPMHLALQNEMPEGYYALGIVEIQGHNPD